MTDRLLFSPAVQEDFKRIEREARAQVSAAILADTQKSLEYGEPIAWAETPIVGKATNGLSPIHRVGLPRGDGIYTTCGAQIAPPALWLSLSAALTRSMARCGHCEAKYAEQPQGIAA